MTDVHGINVFGGTFPAEIWHSVYSERAKSPARNSANPRQPISWAPFYGQFTASQPADNVAGVQGAERRQAKATLPGQRRGRRLQPQRLRARRRPGTDAAAAAAPPPPSRAVGDAGVGRAESGGSGVAEHRAGGRLRPDLGRLPRLSRGAGRWRRGSAGASSGRAIVALRHRLRPGPAAALPRRLQLRRLRPPRGPSTASTPTCHARRGARRPGLRPRHWTERDQRLRPALHPGDLPARLAAGRRRGLRPQGGRGALGARPWSPWSPGSAPARGVDPLRAAAFVALNPLVLVHVVGGAHNDGLVDAAGDARRRRRARRARRPAAAPRSSPPPGSRPRPPSSIPFALLGSGRRRPRFLLGGAGGAGR